VSPLACQTGSQTAHCGAGRCRIALGLILLLAVAVRFQGLGAKSLWYDEALSWRLQGFPPAEIVQRASEAGTTHPPMYFLLLHFWARAFGESEFALRSLAAVAGVATTWGMFFLVREVVLFPARGAAGPQRDAAVWAGLVASLLAAVSPFHVYFAKQVRGYTLGMLLFVLSSWALLRMLAARSKRAAALWATGYGLLGLAFCYTHSLAVFSIAAQAVFIIVHFWRAPRAREAVKANAISSDAELCSRRGDPGEPPADVRRFVRVCVLGAGLLVLVGYAPWLPSVWRQSENLRTSWERPLSVSALVQQPFAGLAGIPDSVPVEPEALAWTVTFVLLAVLLVSGMGGGPGGVFLFLAGTIPLLLNVAYSTVSVRSIFVARYFAFVQPAWLASFALAVSRIPRYPERALVAAVLVLWSGFGWSEYWDALGPGHKPGMRAAAAHVSEGHAAGEMVLAQTPWVYFKLAYYLPAHIPVRLCVDVVDRQGHFGSTHLQPSDMITLDDAIAGQPARLWIVTSRCYNYTGYLYPDIALPTTWRMSESRYFEQDIRWERPIEVKCFVHDANEEHHP
jgi:hypothetical protein